MFSVRSRRARTARNPRTGRAVAIEKKAWPSYNMKRVMRILGVGGLMEAIQA
jgi:nucleoid DNA-binding protein